MADNYDDRMRWRQDAARKAAGELPEMPKDAYTLAALGELAKRMGFGDVVADAITDEIAGLFMDEGISPSDDQDEWRACFADLDERVARLTDGELVMVAVKAVAAKRWLALAADAVVTA
jgi:hypothetical protein